MSDSVERFETSIADTDARLRAQLGDAFEPYKAVHNGVARLERTENTINKVARILP